MQKKIHALVLVVTAGLLYYTGYAQTLNASLGSKTPYTAPAKNDYTPAPPGFRPVFINYTGRHGARFLTKAGSDVTTARLLEEAGKQQQLTPLGKNIQRMLERFLLIETGSYENITLLGTAEQQGIGKRMLATYPGVFKGAGLQIVTTYKVRTQQSARGWLAGLPDYRGNITFRIHPETTDPVLRFYDASPAYTAFKSSGALPAALDSLNNDPRSTAAITHICSKLFSPAFIHELATTGITVMNNGKKVTLKGSDVADNLYDLYSVQFSITGEMQKKGYARDSIDFSIAFNQADLNWLGFKNDAADFLEKGPGTDTLGLQVRIALPLLADYLNTTDSIVQGQLQADAVLRFTHAEAIAPFATLLGIPLASKPARSIYNYRKGWEAADIIPLSANIQWILYSDGQQHLLKVLLNEKETPLPLPAYAFPYYRWADVKNYYLQKMAGLHINPKQHMDQYLLEIK